jgi:hypothetical protein
MQKTIEMADILIHVPADISNDSRHKIEEDLQGCDGMISAHFSAAHEHMLKVVYDPAAIISETILKHVHDQGVKASMIGL